jgi:hypothetical protein
MFPAPRRGGRQHCAGQRAALSSPGIETPEKRDILFVY